MIWSLLERPRRRSKSRPRPTFRPMLEALETRDCPSSGGGTALAPLAILNFSANPTNLPGSRQVELKGTVQDFDPASVTLTFTGEATGSVTAKADGTFDLLTIAAGLGPVTAAAKDTAGSTALATALVSSASPIITSFQIIQCGGGCWTFRGTVWDEAPAGMVVQFSGNPYVAGLTATVDGNGNFSATFFLPNLTSGSVSAQTQDVWGLVSNIVTDPIV